jgi:hypothetical protein
MKYLSDYANIIPLTIVQDTVAGTSVKVKHYGGDFSILCGAQFAATGAIGLVGSTAADYSASKANNVAEFSVVEATSSTSAGSVISGATLSLGCATANVIRGAAIGLFEITSGLTTAVSITINGKDYHTATTGPGRDGTAVATEVAKFLNGGATGATKIDKILHYEALPNAQSSGVITLSPDDDQATGITMSASAAGLYRPLGGICQGCINIQGSKLSTNTPKYIGVVIAETTGVVAKSVHLVRGGAFPGAVVNVTT